MSKIIINKEDIKTLFKVGVDRIRYLDVNIYVLIDYDKMLENYQNKIKKGAYVDSFVFEDKINAYNIVKDFEADKIEVSMPIKAKIDLILFDKIELDRDTFINMFNYFKDKSQGENYSIKELDPDVDNNISIYSILLDIKQKQYDKRGGL